MRLQLWAAVLGVVIGAGPLGGLAQNADPVAEAEKQWEDAKQNYAAELSKLQKSVDDHFAAFERKARERGDTKRLKELSEERVAYEESGAMPKYFDRFSYARHKRTAQSDLKNSQKVLLTAYLKAKRDAEALELEDELASLLEPPSDEATTKDARVRWLNTSYKTTIHQIKSKEWAETQNWDQVVKWRLKETGRTREYIELYNMTRRETWRVYGNRVDLKEGDGWKLIAHGRWKTVADSRD